MTTTERPAWITPEMARQAVIDHGGPCVWLQIVRNLMTLHSKTAADFNPRLSRELIIGLLDEYWGKYIYVGPRGGISRRYTGLVAARAAAYRHSPKAVMVMIETGGGTDPYVVVAARLLSAFNGRPYWPDRLLEMVLAERAPEINTPEYRAWALRRGAELNTETAAA